jgi:poly-gamma-glutamate capsule biosynthesis protein CapA/YwtB (metallophosphatase superfamily)
MLVRVPLVLGIAAAGLGASWILGSGPPDSTPASRLTTPALLSPTPSRAALRSPAPGLVKSEPAPPQPRRFTIAATGDILVHSAVWERAGEYAAGTNEAFDFRPMFRKVKGILSAADVAICHLETPLSPDSQDLSSFPIFNVPREVADAIAYAGYDICSTSSNHSLDQGTDGITATLRALEDAGIEHAGTARNKAESRRPTLLDVNGVSVAHLSYSYGFNGFVPPSDRPWVVNKIDPEAIIDEAIRARDRGAEFVVVSLHWGTEYMTAPTAYQLDVAAELVKARAIDLILGHHAHVVQPIDRFGSKYVVYGMGNLLSNMTASLGTPSVQDGVIVHVVVEEVGQRFQVKRVTYTPTWVEQGTTWRILPVAAMLDTRATPQGTRPLLEASWTRTVAAVESLGARRVAVAPKREPARPVA